MNNFETQSLTCDTNTRLFQFLEHSICDFPRFRWFFNSRCRQSAHDFALSLECNLTIAQKGCQHLFMPEVLAPRFELFRRLADVLAELDKGVPEAMGIEIRQAGTPKCLAKDRPNGRGAAPAFPCQPCDFKLALGPKPDECCRK